MIRILVLCLVTFAFVGCGKVYYDRNNEKFRYYQKKDKGSINQEEQAGHAFNLDEFINPVCDTCSSVQYVAPHDIESIMQKRDELLVIFYFPACKAAEGDIKLAKAAEERNIPYILISISNNPEEMKKWYKTAALKNRNCYILPYSDGGLLSKKIPFLSKLCANCYSMYKDELIMVDYVFLKDGGKSIKMLDLENSIYTPEDALQWLVQHFPLAGN